jgi:hypothetical protein
MRCTPTVLPLLSPLTNAGTPTAARMRGNSTAASAFAIGVRGSYDRASGTPAACRTCRVRSLSIATAEAAQPEPTNGRSCSSNMPWTVPSSPYGPCKTGKAHSMRAWSSSHASAAPGRSGPCDDAASPGSQVASAGSGAFAGHHAPSRAR